MPRRPGDGEGGEGACGERMGQLGHVECVNSLLGHYCAVVLECGEGARLVNKEPCRFQLSTCDQLFVQREVFSRPQFDC